MNSCLNQIDSIYLPALTVNSPVTSFDPPANLGTDCCRILNNFSELETIFCQAIINFSEEQIVQYVRNGHLPPPQQAFKIRKIDNNNIATSLVVLASGTIFRTGKNKEIEQSYHGMLVQNYYSTHSIPGGNESVLMGEGMNKSVFSIEDLNTHKRVAISAARFTHSDCLSEMQNEADVTSKIHSLYILPVAYYARVTKSGTRKGYLESEVCTGGTLKQHPSLANNQIVQQQIYQAVRDTHSAGFAHLDIDFGNIVFVQSPNEQNSHTLKIKLIDFAKAKKLQPCTKEELTYTDARDLGRLFQSSF